jgi:GDP-4-dehydro-6-deoxy-D-mannose reductase
MVTGALGFVGRHLVRSLVLAGLPVVGIDRVRPGDTPPERVGEFLRQPGDPEYPGFFHYEGPAGSFHYLTCPLDQAGPLAAAMASLQPVMVYHLAAQSSAALSFQDPGGTLDTNIRGTLNLLEAVRALPEAAWPVLLSVGSCEEYGPQPAETYPLKEDAPLNPLSPYAVSKVTQTLLGRQYATAWDMPVILVRSFSHTGPGQDPRFAFPAFARQIAAAEAGKGPAEIATGDLSGVRDFLHVKDVIDAYRLLMKEGRPGEIYNVCSGRPLTIREGLDIMIAEAICPISVRTDPARLRPADTPIMVGDNSKLISETGWAPEWDITQTLRDLLIEARRELA